MKTSKKLICFLCCLVVIFTCATISWQPEADAAAPIGAYVSSLVGSFILSAGFSFDNRGDFQSATEAFLESDVARGITEITTHIGNICALGNMSEPLLIHELINAGFFKDFWNSIYEFFGDGDIIIDTGSLPTPRNGYAYYNGVELPILPKLSYPYNYVIYLYDDGNYRLIAFTYTSIQTTDSTVTFRGCSGSNYILSNDTWTRKETTSASWLFYRNKYLWSDIDIPASANYPLIEGNPPITEGQENYDVIGVYNNEVYTPTDIINSWERVVENGGTIDWALDSIPAYDDITSDDKDAPVTQTQSGVLTQSGVKVQTDEEVKEEVKQEAIQELKNYTVTGLASIFPFCIPFDIYNFFSVLTAEREAPVFDFSLNFGKLGSHHVHVDLSGWDTVAQILRTIELLAFCVALAWGTSKLIKW